MARLKFGVELLLLVAVAGVTAAQRGPGDGPRPDTDRPPLSLVQSHLGLYRPGTGTVWILAREGSVFRAVYAQGDPGTGIGGYDLKSPLDRIFTFDYAKRGVQDHLVLYRPGSGTIWILKRNSNTGYSPVYASGAGIGGYDLKSTADHALNFDYESTGRQDHLVFYRPGTGTLWILKNNGGIFGPVYAQGDPGNGIGGFDLRDPRDHVFTFDYDHSGKRDHLVLYRPGAGKIWILKNMAGVFVPVYPSESGIGGYDLLSHSDNMFAFDYTGTGKRDHLVAYRPGTGTIWILQNNGGAFNPVYASSSGIGGYDLKSTTDRVLSFDYARTGILDHLVLYRPGTGTIWILRNRAGEFSAVYAQGDPGSGIGGYDLASPLDRVFTYDYATRGRPRAPEGDSPPDRDQLAVLRTANWSLPLSEAPLGALSLGGDLAAGEEADQDE